MERTSRLTIIKLILSFMIVFALSLDNAHSQSEISLKNDDTLKTLKTENIISIKAKDYLLNTYDLKLIGDSMFFYSDLIVDSIGNTELDFINTIRTTDRYVFAINVNDIQVINYSKFESRKFYDKYWKHNNRARRNLYCSTALVVSGGVLFIPGLIIPGTIIISLGVLNHIKYVYDKKITFKTEDYNLTEDWKIVKY